MHFPLPRSISKRQCYSFRFKYFISSIELQSFPNRNETEIFVRGSIFRKVPLRSWSFMVMGRERDLACNIASLVELEETSRLSRSFVTLLPSSFFPSGPRLLRRFNADEGPCARFLRDGQFSRKKEKKRKRKKEKKTPPWPSLFARPTFLRLSFPRKLRACTWGSFRCR